MNKLFSLVLAIVSFIGMAFAAVNINTATQAELESLRGVGPLRAKAIIAYREKHGPFKTLEEVDNVPGIGKGTISRMAPDVTLSGPTTSLGPDKVAQAEKGKPEPKPAAKPEAKPAAKSETTTADERKAKAAEKKAELVDINHASQKDLETLPGVGEARAKAIIKGRPYKGKDDLIAKKVVPESVYADIKDRIVAKQR